MNPPASPVPSGAAAATPLPPAGTAPPTPVAAAAAVVLVELPRALAAARAVLLEAVVQSRNPNGTTTLKTDSGPVVVKTPTPLAIGAAFTIDITRVGDQLNARLLPQGASRQGVPADAGRPATSAIPIATSPTDTVTTGASKPTNFTAVALSPGHAASAASTPAATTTAAAAGKLAPPSDTSAKTAAPRSGSTVPVPSSGTVASPAASPPTAQAQAAPSSNSRSPPSTTMTTTAASTSSTMPSDGKAAPTSSSPATGSAPATPQAGRPADAAASAQARQPPPSASGTSTPVLQQPTTSSLPPSAAMPARPGASPSPPAGTLPPGTTVEMRLATPATASRPGEPARPPAITATVIATLPQGRAIIDTPMGRLVAPLPTELAAKPGDTLALEWFPETLHAPGGATRRTGQQPHARGWDAAREAATALLEDGNAALRATGERLVPRPGARLAEQLMLFIGRGDGDLARWLGESTLRQLEAGRNGEMLARGEAGAAREGEDAKPSEWRHVTVPLFDGHQLRPVDIHARRRRMSDHGRPRDQSRFVVECLHDALGPIQIDGLLTAGDGRRRLDIILRTHAEMPAEDRAALDALFNDTCGAIGMQGALVFQAVPRFPDITQDSPATHRSVVA